MKKLFNFFTKNSQSQAYAKGSTDTSVILSAKTKSDGKNGEITPGTLFEHYKDVLIRPEDILNKLE